MYRLIYWLWGGFLLLSVAGCDQGDTDAGTQQALLISGEIDIQGPVYAKGGSTLTVRLENLETLPVGNAVIVEKQTSLEKPQQPVPFKLRVYRDQLQVGARYILRILFQTANGQQWSNIQIYPFNRASTDTHLGKVPLQMIHSPSTDATTLFLCGKKTVRLFQQRQKAQLHIQDDVYHLVPAISSSGAKYLSEDQHVLFWNKGVEAMLRMVDFDWPICTRVSEDILTLFPFQAHGNEPAWTLSANVDEVILDWNYGQQHLVMPYPELDLTQSGFVLHSKIQLPLLKVNVLNSLCRDSMTGRPYPQHVELHYADLHLSGCGGNSHSLLTGEEWLVEDINGQRLLDFTRITLHFDSEGRLSGYATCNQYTTAYEFNEQLDIAEPIVTRKSCAAALMVQEQRFLSLLKNIKQIDFDPSGALLLSTADGQTLTARR